MQPFADVRLESEEAFVKRKSKALGLNSKEFLTDLHSESLLSGAADSDDDDAGSSSSSRFSITVLLLLLLLFTPALLMHYY